MEGIVSILGLVVSGVKLAVGVGTEIPNIVQGVANIIPPGKKLVGDIEQIVADIKAGKYGQIEPDLAAIVADVQAVFAAVEVEIPAISSLVASASSLPSTATIATVKKLTA